MKKVAILLGFCMVVAFLPTFVPQPVSAMTGSGTAGDPYVIYNVTDLQNMASHLGSYYTLNNSIDASDTSTWNSGQGFIPVGTWGTPFTGYFNGNNYTISGLYINRPASSYQGLFGSTSWATIKCVSVEAEVHGLQYNGIIIGRTSSTVIQNCYASGNVSGTHSNSHAGGIAGYTGAGTVYRCFSDASISGVCFCGVLIGYSSGTSISECAGYGSVTGSTQSGGLVGMLYGGSTLTNSYGRGAVTSTSTYSAGLIGQNYESYITNCYSTGLITGSGYGMVGSNIRGSCSNSFWDKDTSGKTTSAQGTGKATSEMKTQSTFTDAGWNFTGIWSIGGYINDGYPYFAWWYNPPDIIADVNQVVWFQPNAIIEGIILPNRAQSGTLQDGEFTWGSNPAGVTISHGELIPEEEYDFQPVIPGGQDIINPEPEGMTGDVDTERLKGNPLYPLVQMLSIGGFLNERLVWLGLAWFILIAAMFGVHLGFDTKKDTEKPQHFVLTTITGLGLAILFYTMGIFPWWVPFVLSLGLIGAIIWERQPVL